MQNLSGNNSRPNSAKTNNQIAKVSHAKDAKERAADLENSVSDFIGSEVSEKLEQDKFEGVDAKEWVKKKKSFPLNMKMFTDAQGKIFSISFQDE